MVFDVPNTIADESFMSELFAKNFRGLEDPVVFKSRVRIVTKPKGRDE